MRRGIACMLLVPEREDAHAGGLREAAEVRDRDARHAIDRVEPVQLERVDQEVEPVGEGLRLRCGRHSGVLSRLTLRVCFGS
jgi:hypothetical protein